MSREMDLLRRLAEGDNRGDFFISLELLKEVEAILAQPEQEPVAWMYEWEEMGGKEWTSVKNGKYPPIVEEEYCMRNLRPLYASPPKREPLSEKEIREGNQSMLNATRGAFINGVRFAELMHGIVGGE